MPAPVIKAEAVTKPAPSMPAAPLRLPPQAQLWAGLARRSGRPGRGGASTAVGAAGGASGAELEPLWAGLARGRRRGQATAASAPAPPGQDADPR